MGEEFGEKRGRRFSPLAIIGMVIGGLALAVLFAFLLGWIVMLLWNWLMPEIFRLPRIGYWQAWGLVLLSHILIKPGYGGHTGHESKKSGSHANGGDWKKEFRKRFGNCGEEARPSTEGASSGDSSDV